MRSSSNQEQVEMIIFPSGEEIDRAAELLVNRYGVSPQLLGQLFGIERRGQANEILQKLGEGHLGKEDLAKLIIMNKGSNLFGDSKDDAVKELRKKLISHLTEPEMKVLFEAQGPKNSAITDPHRMVRPLVAKKWHPGGPWPRAFVRALGFPQIFAGVTTRTSLPTFQDFPARRTPPALADFQIYLKGEMRSVLEREGQQTRCVLTLPTGSGKTRVAVEAFIDWMHLRFANGQYLVWIAQSEELCEQAISCIQQMWSSREYPSDLRVYRYFGGRAVNVENLKGGAVVASIQQLHNRIKAGDEALEMILQSTGVMIIDEAHRAVSIMYDGLLSRAEVIRGHDLFPICGLTATPGRAGIAGASETFKLVNRFEAHLIKPNLGSEYSADPLRYFRDHRFLAKARHIVHHSGREYELTDADLEGDGLEKDLPAGFLKQLANDSARNLVILERLLKIPVGTPTLVYSCTVDHAYFLSTILTKKGRRAGAISSETSLTIRRGLIQEFKDGKIDFLCNFGVLTTGFDAPKTRCIAICRPTMSVILYEQIIGRGLRGPEFGGTEECDIIDFADNFKRLGLPRTYERFLEFWSWSDEIIENAEINGSVGACP